MKTYTHPPKTAAIRFFAQFLLFALLFLFSPSYVIYAQNFDDITNAHKRASEAYKAKDYDRGIREFTEVIRLINEHKKTANSANVTNLNKLLANTYFLRGAGYIDKREFDKAIDDLTEGLKIDANYDSAFFFRGLAYFYKRRI